MAARSEVWVCGRSLAGIAGSNPAGGNDVYLLCVCCVLSGTGLCVGRSDHSSRGSLPSLVCPSVIVKPRQREGPCPRGAVMP